MMNIGVLALQGAFIEHERILNKIGVDSFEIRNLDDWSKQKDGLIIPGGESTTQLKLLKDLGLLQPIEEDINNGLPVFGTCAGLILLAKNVENKGFARISTMDINVCRNAYGRQLGSFYAEDKFDENASYNKNGESIYGLKPYIYYSCRYKPNDNSDFVITYSLDSYITIQGIIDRKSC